MINNALLDTAKHILQQRHPDLRIVSGFFVDGRPVFEGYLNGEYSGIEADPYYLVDLNNKKVTNYAVSFDVAKKVLNAERKYYLEGSK